MLTQTILNNNEKKMEICSKNVSTRLMQMGSLVILKAIRNKRQSNIGSELPDANSLATKKHLYKTCDTRYQIEI